jgi:cell division septation protein DedD
LLLGIPLAALHAQGADSLTSVRADEVLARVRRYTSSDVSAARALADSLVTSLPAGSASLPAALFAKASIAPSAAEAERDYSRIVNEFRFAPQVPDALMRLALLESARNNRAGALKNLDRLLRDHSDAAVRSRASLLAGRLRMEAGDPARACDLLAAAYASAGNAERDVRDQAESIGASCPTPVAVMARRDPPPMGVMRAPSESTVAPVIAAASAPARGTKRQTAVPAKPAAAPVRRDTAPTPKPAPVVVKRDTAPTPKPVPVVVKRDTAPTPKPTPTPVPPTTAPPIAPATNTRYGVQFAAYNDKPGAENLASVLRERGITARVEGDVKPFRVRAGRFATRAEAEASAALWRRPGQPAMVVTLGPNP